MKRIVMLFFLSMLSLNMALRGDRHRDEGRMEERRLSDPRTGIHTSPSELKDRRSSRDDRDSPFGRDRMRDGRRKDMEFPRISGKQGASKRERWVC
ncbi:unnamed protein product [Cylicostephanus goldi]|uniref:Uncharacterized protein n=1 Tax=Cylicostephanus goldi TaxID=71465 RepID=A0A3P7MPV2_CYLGO|nr:unnamed protein product [Cylicostephanus goldi]